MKKITLSFLIALSLTITPAKANPLIVSMVPIVKVVGKKLLKKGIKNFCKEHKKKCGPILVSTVEEILDIEDKIFEKLEKELFEYDNL